MYIVLQVLSFVAENERVNISQRTKEGLNIAKLKGKKLGRPTSNLPNDYIKVLNSYINKTTTAKEAMDSLNVSRGTFYKKLREYKAKL